MALGRGGSGLGLGGLFGLGGDRRDGLVVVFDGVSVRLRVNSRARRVSLRVDPRSGEVVAVSPSARRLAEAERFARSRRDWIAQRLAGAAMRRPLVNGAAVPFRGRTLTLRRIDGRAAARLSADGAELSAAGDDEGFRRRVLSWLKRQARADLADRTAHHAAALGAPAPSVTLNDARSRWGSCTPGRSAIRYNWRLICAPDWVLDYVAAHEVAHLRFCDHGADFWALVARLYGDPAAARRWLKLHGASLHAVG